MLRSLAGVAHGQGARKRRTKGPITDRPQGHSRLTRGMGKSSADALTLGAGRNQVGVWRRLAGIPRVIQVIERSLGEVYEIESRLPEEGLARRLVLSDPARVRRIARYPVECRTLDDAALLALFSDPQPIVLS